jgi:hypothetical protein
MGADEFLNEPTFEYPEAGRQRSFRMAPVNAAFRSSSIHQVKSSNNSLVRLQCAGTDEFERDQHHDGGVEQATPMKRLTALILILSTTTGCQSIMHELQPHRLWRLNYTDEAGRADGSFLSIEDPPDGPVSVKGEPNAE